MATYDAYTKTIKQTAAPRDVEYRLLAQVTGALTTAKDDLAKSASDPKVMASVMDALNWNNQIWDAFVEDVGAEGNLLPRELRAAIVSLGIWVSKETAEIAAGGGDIESLISVNRAIMRGLNPPKSGSATESDAPPEPNAEGQRPGGGDAVA